MRQKSKSTAASSATVVRNIRRATRKHRAAEEKIPKLQLSGVRSDRATAATFFFATWVQAIDLYQCRTSGLADFGAAV
jgi:hypothetical protein